MKVLDNISKKQTLAFKVMEALKNYIIENKLKEGDSLPSQQKISEQLGVSKTIVREAIRGLEGIGLVESKHGGGVFVKGFSPELLMDGFAFGFDKYKYHEKVKYFFEARECFECGAVDLIIKNINEKDHEKIKKIIYKMKELENGEKALMKKFHKLDYKFHELLLKSTHNPIIIRFNKILRQFFDLITKRPIEITTQEYHEIIEQHDNLYQTICSGKIDLIHKKIKKHIKIAEKRWL